jgi:hypothetical protein
MPSPDQLPSTLQDLAFRNAAKIEAGRDFRQQIGRVIRAIDHLLQKPQPGGEVPKYESNVVTPRLSQVSSEHRPPFEEALLPKIIDQDNRVPDDTRPANDPLTESAALHSISL